MCIYYRISLNTAKYTTVLIFYLLFLLPEHSIAQEDIYKRKVNVSNNISIFNALKEIEKQTGYSFSYNSELFDDTKQVRETIRDEPLDFALVKILNDTTLYNKTIGNQIIIYKPVFSEHSRSRNDSLRQTHYIKITGRVLDKNKQHPIPYSTISLSGYYKGTVVNNEGEFSLTITSENLDDSLLFSCLGYKSKYVLAGSLVTQYKKIELEPDYIPIQEVVIRRINPEALLSNTIDQIRYNYPDFPANFTAFYRETIKKRDVYIAVTEAVVKGYKSSYTNDLASDKVKIVKGRKKIDEQHKDTILVKIKAGLHNVLFLDIVKTPPEFINKEYFPLYYYSVSDMVVLNEKDVYVVTFTEREISNLTNYKGKIYIEDKTHAILGAEFSLDRSGLKSAASYMIVKKPAGLKVKPVKANYYVQYNLMNNKYYLNYVRGEIILRIRKRKQLFNSEYLMTLEMVMNDFDTVNVEKIPFKESARYSDITKEHLGAYDPQYWNQYDYISPDKSLLNAFEKKQKEE